MNSLFVFGLNQKLSLLHVALCDLLLGLCSVSIGSVYFSLACGQTSDWLTTTVLDQLKRLMRPSAYHVTQRAERGAPRQAGSVADYEESGGDNAPLVGS